MGLPLHDGGITDTLFNDNVAAAIPATCIPGIGYYCEFSAMPSAQTIERKGGYKLLLTDPICYCSLGPNRSADDGLHPMFAVFWTNISIVS